jgi:leucyl aminopeptidase
MKISLASGRIESDRSALTGVLLSVDETLPKWLPGPVAEALREPVKLEDFTGKKLQKLSFYAGRRRCIAVGLGEQKDLDPGILRCAAAAVTRAAREAKAGSVALAFGATSPVAPGDAARALAEGLVLGEYQYHGQKTQEPKAAPVREARIFWPGRKPSRLAAELRLGRIGAEAQCFARDLANAPGNVATPTKLAAEARRIAKEPSVRCKVLRKPELVRRKFGGLLGVNAGSDEPPVFLEMEYRPPRYKRTVCLVGKGLTFDSGGISLKPPAGMEEMKFDMCGGAAVLGTMRALAHWKPPHVRVWGLVPSTENLAGGRAIKPGDVLRSYGGITMEVVNTDAEGRLILADALGRAQELGADYTIDLATLTGACVVALGHRASGLFTESDELRRRLMEAGEATGERFWPLPHWEEYQEELKSTVADVKNLGSRWGGAITAYAFLRKFAGDLVWAHLDIAGTAWDMPKSEIYDGGGTGIAVRALLRFLGELK